ncbi:MAG: hypothetical protein ACRD7E_27165, partial [Bryobacteraceae bacterium]
DIILACALLAACGRSEESLKDALPVQVQRIWVLKATSEIPNEQAPAMIRSLGLKRAIAATYGAEKEIQVRVYEMDVAASAFELIQKWKQADGLAIYKGSYFAVAPADDSNRVQVGEFLRGFQQELGEPASDAS